MTNPRTDAKKIPNIMNGAASYYVSIVPFFMNCLFGAKQDVILISTKKNVQNGP